MIPSSSSDKTADKKSIAAKIRALLAKSIENGCTEAEALGAMEKAHELLAKYQLSLSDLDLREEGTTRKTAPKDYRGIGRRLASRVAKFCDCKAWSSTSDINFLGLDSDVQLCEWLLAALTGFCQRATLEWSLETGETIPNIIESFLQGTIDRINSRLKEETDKRRVVGVSSGRDLVPLKNAMINEAFAKLGINLTIKKNSKTEVTSAKAYMDGQSAGDGASFHRPLRQSQNGPLLIGAK